MRLLILVMRQVIQVLFKMDSASNTIRGVYHNARTPNGGSVAKIVIEFITIATIGNATDFGDMNYSSRQGCGFSESHGGLPL